MNQDTIAAISTGMTNSGIGIVRISGSEALEIADRVYKGKETITEVPTHTIHYGHVMDGDETVDEVLVMVMRGPRTFTGEDTVEINCHGGTYVVSRVLETVLKAGARPAEPGEFTKRAFLNGKMDLSQAEAVIDVITSENEYALQSSISQLKGSVKNRIKEIREKIIYHTAFIETALDDPEHISVDGYGEVLKEAAEEVIDQLKELIDSSDDGRIMKEGIQTVILGKPNADDTYRPERAKPYPKRVVVFSPHPDDDVISMGGTIRRLVEQKHEVHVAYQTSGNIAVGDEEVVRFMHFINGFNQIFINSEDQVISEKYAEIRKFLKDKKDGDMDTRDILTIKGLIRRGEARTACTYNNIPLERCVCMMGLFRLP